MVAVVHHSALWLLLLTITTALSLLHVAAGAASPDWTDCPGSCRCKWTSGKKSALCKEAGFTTIPATLSSDMQVLDLAGNNIPYLTKDAFRAVGLINLQRIFLKGAQVRQVNRDAFKDLIILIEVDLSDNSIGSLHPDTFTGNDRLRELHLNGNPLTELRANQFPTLPHLRTLELQECQLRLIHRDAFINVISLETLNLKSNQLKQLSERVFLPISKLKTLVLDGNPWRCDCELRGFRNWLLSSNLYSTRLTCQENDVLYGRFWEDVKPLEFACAPQVNLSERMVQEEVGGNVSFRCHIRGDPEPEVTWLFNGRAVGSANMTHEQIFLIDEEQGRREKWTNLSILNLTEHDGGEYSCMASNSRGVTSRNVTLLLPQVVTATTLSKTESWLLWAGLAAGGVVALALALVTLVCTCCVCGKQRRRRKHRRKNKLKSSVSFTDQEKKLLDVSITTTTERNNGSFEALSSQPDMEMMESASLPMELCDPPVHITIESHAEAMGAAYPGAMTVFPPPPEFSTSALPSGAYGNIFISVSVSQEPNSLDVLRYPDLLDLPHRPSKAASVSVAAGPDSPFMGNVATYATLPRRPRHKEHTDPLVRVGPQYDNMGPRVTAGGSSTLSLPDADLEEQLDYIPPPPMPPQCSPIVSEYVSL